ncbi:MAG: hypothetical protein AAGD96_32840, partial [Chloroflexota bacterium]
KKIGDSFQIHFVWRLPNQNFLHALFRAKILDIDANVDRYLISLPELLAKKEENESGTPLPEENHTADYWAMVYHLVGRKAHVAFEADDGRPLYLRLPTLTLEHKYFTRYSDKEESSEHNDWG